MMGDNNVLFFLQEGDEDNYTTSAVLYGSYKRWLSRFASPAIISQESRDRVEAEDAQNAFIRQALHFG